MTLKWPDHPDMVAEREALHKEYDMLTNQRIAAENRQRIIRSEIDTLNMVINAIYGD